MEVTDNIQFGTPVLLWAALAAVPCLLVFFLWAWRRKQAAMSLFIPARLFGTLLSGYSARREKVRYALLGTAMVLGLLALAQPRWGFTWEEVRQRGLDVVVAVDTSRSMLAPDLAPTRLARARLACIDLMRVARTDRLGLVAFAGSAFLQCPLTFDDEAFRLSLGAVDTGLIPQGGSSLAEAIRVANEAFKKDEDNHKVLVLLTDGEDHEEGVIEVAKEAAKNGLKIFTIGVGTPNGELLSFRDEQGKVEYVRDDSGNIVRSRLNEDLLREIATVGNGFYLPLSGTKTMETLYEQGLAGLPKSESNSQYIQRFQERFQWPLALLIVLLALEWLLQGAPKESGAENVARKNPAPKLAAVIVIFCLSGGAVSASPSQARRSFEAGDYKAAFEEYQRLSRLKPSDARLHYNAGAAAYRANELEAAVNQFSEALRTPDLELQRDAYYNRGNTRYRQGENSAQPADKQQMWESALNDYDRALKLNPTDADAKFNRDLVQRKLEELKKQEEQQQQQQGDNQDKQENKDDQQKQDQKKKQDGKDQKGQDEKQKQDQQEKDKKGDQKEKDQQQAKQDKGQEKSKQEEDAKKQEQDAADKQGEKKEQDAAQKQKSKEGKDKEGKEAQPAQSGEAMAAQGEGEMTLEQAMQLLDELKVQERALIFQPPKDNKPKPKIFKDW